MVDEYILKHLQDVLDAINDVESCIMKGAAQTLRGPFSYGKRIPFYRME